MDTKKVTELIQSALDAVGYEYVGHELIASGSEPGLRIYIDAERGVTVDDCAKASRQISAVFAVDDPNAAPYRFEVSSPGADRPLFTPAQYERFIGHDVNMQLAQPQDGQRKWKGTIKSVEGEQICLSVEGKAIYFSIDQIAKARLVPEF